MRSFLLSKVAIPLHLAFIACYLACVRIGLGSVLEYLPLAWLAAGLIEITLLFPTARKGEEVYDARRRVWVSLLKDPICHAGVVGFLFLLLQTLNGPRIMLFDRQSGEWEFVAARIRDFPACINQIASVDGLFWNILTIPAILVVRNGLGKKGRQLLLKYLVIIAAMVALYGLITYNPKVSVPGKFANFPDPVTAGTYFFMHFCVACALYANEVGMEIRDKFQCHALFASCLLTLAGALYSLSCLTIAMTAGALVIVGIYCMIYLSGRLTTAEKMRMTATGLILIGLVAFLHVVGYPQNRIHGCTAKIFSGEWTTPEEQAEREVKTAIARRMFRANIIHGVGTWGYADANCFGKYTKDDEWDVLGESDATPPLCGNDSLQGLAEYGTVGFLIVIAPFLILLFDSLARLAVEFRPKGGKSSDGTMSSEHEARPFTERIPPLALALFIAIGGAFAVSFFFSVFRQPLVLFSWAIFFAIFPTLIRKPASA